MITAIGCLLVVVAVVYTHSAMVPKRTGMIVMNGFTGKERSLGPGFNFPIFLWETVSQKDISLRTNVHVFKADFETRDEAVVSMNIAFHEKAEAGYLAEYLSFENPDERLKGIREKIKSILTIEVRKLKNRDAVMDKIGELQEMAKEKFENSHSEDGIPLQRYFGTNLEKVLISDPELPESVRKAEELKEVQEKENERRKLEMENLKKMASALVAEAKKHGQELPYNVALRRVQIQLEKKGVQENSHTFGIEQGTQELLGSAIKEVFGGRKSKK